MWPLVVLLQESISLLGESSSTVPEWAENWSVQRCCKAPLSQAYINTALTEADVRCAGVQDGKARTRPERHI